MPLKYRKTRSEVEYNGRHTNNINLLTLFENSIRVLTLPVLLSEKSKSIKAVWGHFVQV